MLEKLILDPDQDQCQNEINSKFHENYSTTFRVILFRDNKQTTNNSEYITV